MENTARQGEERKSQTDGEGTIRQKERGVGRNQEEVRDRGWDREEELMDREVLRRTGRFSGIGDRERRKLREGRQAAPSSRESSQLFLWVPSAPFAWPQWGQWGFCLNPLWPSCWVWRHLVDLLAGALPVTLVLAQLLSQVHLSYLLLCSSDGHEAWLLPSECLLSSSDLEGRRGKTHSPGVLERGTPWPLAVSHPTGPPMLGKSPTPLQVRPASYPISVRAAQRV
jgi:hypothetical protein